SRVRHSLEICRKPPPNRQTARNFSPHRKPADRGGFLDGRAPHVRCDRNRGWRVRLVDRLFSAKIRRERTARRRVWPRECPRELRRRIPHHSHGIRRGRSLHALVNECVAAVEGTLRGSGSPGAFSAYGRALDRERRGKVSTGYGRHFAKSGRALRKAVSRAITRALSANLRRGRLLGHL